MNDPRNPARDPRDGELTPSPRDDGEEQLHLEFEDFDPIDERELGGEA